MELCQLAETTAALAHATNFGVAPLWLVTSVGNVKLEMSINAGHAYLHNDVIIPLARPLEPCHLPSFNSTHSAVARAHGYGRVNRMNEKTFFARF